MSFHMSATVVYEKTGEIFNMVTDGKTITVIPKYGCGFKAIMAFYRMIVEKIDPDATIKISGDDKDKK